MTYDPVLGLWTSEDTNVWSSQLGVNVAMDSSSANNAGVFFLPAWDAYYYAGVWPWFRVFGHGYNTFGPANNYIQLNHWDISNGGPSDFRSLGPSASAYVGTQTVTWGFDSGWGGLDAAASPKSLMQTAVQIFIAATHPDDVLSCYPTVRMRWVSR
jgi:hypothetical protein